jgi:hypothetical protein
MYCAPVVPIWFWTSSSNIAQVPELKWAIMYLPTRPFELTNPLGCLSVAELRRIRGFCAAQAPHPYRQRLRRLIVTTKFRYSNRENAWVVSQFDCGG